MAEQERQRKVLIIDDEPGVCKILSKSLTEAGYDTSQAGDGSSGVKMIEEINPDLVLLDLKLPGGIDGIEVLRRIKEQDPERLVIIITAYASPKAELEGMRYGAYGEITKPFDLNNVVKIVRDALKTKA